MVESKRYKVKIYDDYAGDFIKVLKDMNIDYKITNYAINLVIWGITLDNEEQINKIKSLHYVTFFDIMPTVTLN